MARIDFDYTVMRGNPENEIRIRTLLEHLTGPATMRVLEIGVGGGDSTEELARRFTEVTCLDLSQANLDVTVARLREQGIPIPRCIAMPAEEAEFPLGSFDRVVLLNFLEHVENPPRVLAHMRPWLSESGTIHIIVNLATSLHRRLGVKMGVVKHLEELSESDHSLGHYRVYTLELLRQHVTESKYRITLERPFYLKPLPSSMLEKLPMEILEGFRQLGSDFPGMAGYIYMEATPAK